MKKPEQITEKVILPNIALKKLRSAHENRKPVYIYGMSGSGKSILVNTYLKRKKKMYFTAQNSDTEKMYDKISKVVMEKKEITIIIDELQILYDNKIRNEYYRLIDFICRNKNIWLIIISRCQMPIWFRPLQFAHVFEVIDEEDLKLNEAEEKSFFLSKSLDIPDEMELKIRRYGNGSRLLLRFIAKELIKQNESENNQTVNLDYVLNMAGQKAWSYIEDEEYGNLSVILLKFVLELSIVDDFDLGMAEYITGRKDAGKLLSIVMETGNYLKEKNGIYKYRDDIKIGLNRCMAEKMNASDINNKFFLSGKYYEDHGIIIKALKMYKKCDAADSMALLLAKKIYEVTSPYEIFDLKEYYLCLPVSKVMDSPELIGGICILKALDYNKKEYCKWHEILENMAQAGNAGIKKRAVSVLRGVNFFFPKNGVSGLINETLLHCGINYNREIQMNLSLTNNEPSLMNGLFDFYGYSGMNSYLLCRTGFLYQKQHAKYGQGIVKLAYAEACFEKSVDDNSVRRLAETGRLQAEAAGTIENCFVAVGILSKLLLADRCLDDAFTLLESLMKNAEMEKSRIRENIDLFEMNLMLYKGENDKIRQWYDNEAINLNFAEAGFYEKMKYAFMSKVLIVRGEYEKAVKLTEIMLDECKKHDSVYSYINFLLISAEAKERLNNVIWKRELADAVAMAEKYGLVRVISDEGAAIYRLLSEDGQIKWKNENYRKKVFSETERMLYLYPDYLKSNRTAEVNFSENAVKILRLQAGGITICEIARLLCISKNTVKYHTEETYKKLGVNNKTKAIEAALRIGLV